MPSQIFAVSSKIYKFVSRNHKNRYIQTMRNTILAVIALCSAIALHAQTEIEPFVPGVTADGVRYYLPRTAFRVVFTIEKTETVPGRFSKYAYKYLHLQDVPTQPGTSYRILSIELQPYGIPDKTKAYSVRLKPRTIAPMVTLTPDGILVGINADTTPETLPQLPSDQPAPAPVDSRRYMTQEMLMATSNAKLAELVADEIYNIRDSRNALIRGEADNTPKDGEQLQLMLSSLEAQETALCTMFSGQTLRSIHVSHMQLIPETLADKTLLCRFSRRFGLVDSDDLSGEPIYLSITRADTMPDSVPEAAAREKKRPQGIYCNVPVPATFTIYDATGQYTSATFPVAQFGTTELLSSALFDKNATTSVTFHQSTGGVKEIRK